MSTSPPMGSSAMPPLRPSSFAPPLDSPRPIGRGRARFLPTRNEDETAMAILRRRVAQLDHLASAPLTPVSPGGADAARFEDADDDSRFGAAASTPPSTPGTTTPSGRSRRSSFSGSTISSPSTPYLLDHPDCVCYRNKKKVVCRICGNAYHGRVRKACPVHFNVKMLMDNELCKTCGIPGLFEFDVVDDFRRVGD